MRRGAWIGALGGAVAAGAAGAVVATRTHRSRTPSGRESGTTATQPADPDRSYRVQTSDGLSLYVEEAGEPDAALTLLFVHGYGLNRTSWRLQQQDLADSARLVCYDHRSHGRSDRSPAERCTIDQLGEDLQAVVADVQRRSPGPVVLVGHSLGGMTVLALADRAPELIGGAVVGVALLATSAGRLSEVTLGLPAVAGVLLRRVKPRHLVGMSKGLPMLLAVRRPARVLHRRTSLTSSVVSAVVERFSFGGQVAPELVAEIETMIGATGTDVLAAFAPTFLDHDKLAALPTLGRVPTLVLVGDADLMTPVEHSRTIADAVPGAELQVLPDAGHMVPMERPAAVSAALQRLMDRVGQR